MLGLKLRLGNRLFSHVSWSQGASIVENNWLYKVPWSLEARIVEQIIGFVMFLGLMGPELLENHWFCKVSWSHEARIVQPSVL